MFSRIFFNEHFGDGTQLIPPQAVHPRSQVGIIDEELVKNLAICGAVILVVIFALVPNPRIAIWAPGMQRCSCRGCFGGGRGLEICVKCI